MKQKILLTGATGFIGRNVLPQLQKIHDVAAPSRAELDLLDTNAVRRYLENRQLDAVVHLANPTSQNPIDKFDELFDRSLRVFTSLFHCNDLYRRMIYIGSGAEYGKHRAIKQVIEDTFGQELPCDTYGLSRYIMSELAQRYSNIINLRLFACYGCGDPPYKLIPHIISCVKANKPVELRQNVMFDFLYVKDIAPVLMYFIENEPTHRTYNLCSGRPTLISEIAEEVRQQMNSDLPIVFKNEGLGLEYTGNNDRLRAELRYWEPRLLRDGIREILENETGKI